MTRNPALRARRSDAEIGDHFCDSGCVERNRVRVAAIERDRTGCKRCPCALLHRQRLAAAPRQIGTRLASGMSKLDARHRALRCDEHRDSRPGFDLSRVPDSGVAQRNSPFR